MFKLTKIDSRILNNSNLLPGTLQLYRTQLGLRGYTETEIAEALEWAQTPCNIGESSERELKIA
jgi:hypothetical protein